MVFTMKHELLVPVGDYDSLIAAINNGADAVYLGGQKFGARAFAPNFSKEEIKNATKLCHLYGVKIYITVNTLIYEKEISEALEYVKELHKMGVDALIMQDVGFIDLVHKTLPNLEIHASTQMHNHSAESLNFLQNLGVSRVVFARECSLDYINKIDTPLEKEVFIHGSLCISYSGECLFSSLILNRSGNRGECAGMCRLPYKLYEDNKLITTKGDYLLSPKDLCSVNDFEKLMESNIKCFKIEGRMKSAPYVAVVTRIYRNLIDSYEKNKKCTVVKEDLDLLKAIFNREYTKGYLFNDNDIMNIKAPNHQGLKIGEVTKVNSQKIQIKLTHNLKQFSGIRFKKHDIGLNVNFIYDEKGNLINEGLKNTTIYLDNFMGIKKLDDIMLTKPIIEMYPHGYKKIPIIMEFQAKVGKEIKLKVTDLENEIYINSKMMTEKSVNAPISRERIEDALTKLGDSPFRVSNIKIEMDNDIFIPVGVLKNLRREALDKLKWIRENKKVSYIEKEFVKEVREKDHEGISVLVKTKEQLEASLHLKVKNIIVTNPNLYQKGLIFRIPRDNIKHDYSYDLLLATDYASLDKYPNSGADYFLNATNHYTIDYLNKYASTITLSPENSLENIKDIMANYQAKNNIEILVYGHVELMIMKYCPLNYLVNKNDHCSVCQNNKNYYLQDRNKQFYKLENNPLTHSTTIMNTNLTDLREYIPALKKMGIKNFRLEFLDETYEEAKQIIEGVIKDAR